MDGAAVPMTYQHDGVLRSPLSADEWPFRARGTAKDAVAMMMSNATDVSSRENDGDRASSDLSLESPHAQPLRWKKGPMNRHLIHDDDNDDDDDDVNDPALRRRRRAVRVSRFGDRAELIAHCRSNGWCCQAEEAVRWRYSMVMDTCSSPTNSAHGCIGGCKRGNIHVIRCSQVQYSTVHRDASKSAGLVSASSSLEDSMSW
ncbi:hypothetical protein CERZMDRAFT_80406 [Cercospora zeae-maydis SCOH1-5]|uniref:Uncharacterized protein n=1 Tax=Cercospora zeae-maydis SCOH1-5 TaxID=717836 RepID=A0A6A6FWA1_9PEZI|nr:hypothetical protein CERZMDRAFT_80406 [Cercospora zeae-maydis SCOH1-5]